MKSVASTPQAPAMPLSQKLRWASVAVTVVGLVDSLYLTWIKLANKTAVCSTIGDCEAVNNSVYSQIGGIPIALLGAGAYLAILLALLLEARVDFLRENGIQIVYGFSAIGVLYSAYLTYIELFVLQAICPYCVVSAIMLVFLLVFTIMRFMRSQNESQ